MSYPENAGYAVAGYVVTAVVVLAYAVFLFVRLRGTKGDGDGSTGDCR